MKAIKRFVLLGVLGFICNQASAQSLEQSFANPPDSVRPWVYWFWLNGNITSNGITADLEAMKRVGVAGALIMEVDQGAPVGPADFMSERWRGLFGHVHAEAKRLGLEINMNNDAGWNGSGGPWIKPEQSMQKVVWSETNVTGPMHFDAPLPQPETVAGYYRDITVMAFPSPGTNRIDRIRAKAAYEVAGVGESPVTKLAPEMQIERGKIATLQIDCNSRVVWDVPAGQWTLMRFGHTSTGVENAPAPATGRGLECDKLSKEGIEANYAAMMAKLVADTGAGKSGTGLVATHIDSWENGSQNWTALMRQEFEKRRRYDPLPYLPVMSGRVVDNLAISERFLWDLRQTVSEMVIENYAGRMRELAHANGLRFTVEAYGGPCDSIPYAGQSDEPMGEFWSPTGAMETCKTMASAGHIYGKRIVGAEAFTAADQERWREHPAVIKALGDRAFCEGINRFVFHRYAMQPWTEERSPGMTMGPWGQHYERTQTWWEWTRPWHDYLARCQLLLREGHFVADVCYVLPEAPPQGPGDHPRDGYDWDECTAEAVLTRMTVRDGRIVLPDGMSYRMLALSNGRTMTPALINKIKELVEAGAVVVGPRPVASPSLQNYPACDAEVQRVAQELWADCDGHSVIEHKLGKGRVVWGMSPAKVLAGMGTPADFSSDRPLRYIHRSTESADFYFVANSQPWTVATTCAFRVKGKVPEFWCPETGKIERASVWREADGVTQVAVTLPNSGSVFVVFREAAGSADPIASIKYNGARFVSATPDTALKPVVTRAVYGVLDDPQRTRNLTEKVQSKLDQGETSFSVASLAQGDDPAYNVVKTLIVDYTIEGRQFTVKGRDPETVHVGPNAIGAVVETARYGVLDDPARTRDVRAKLQRLIDSGEGAFSVARMADGDDPAFGIVKTLEADVVFKGKHRKIAGTDPELIDLMEVTVPPRPVAMVVNGSHGTVLETAEAGDYQWTTAAGKTKEVSVSGMAPAVSLDGKWELQVPVKEGLKTVKLEKLSSWTEQGDAEIKYFSGTATYRRTIEVSSEMLSKNRRLYLDLGKVQVMAQVKVNSKECGTLWKAPFRVDVTESVKPGSNVVEIRVVNLWINRMIGDEQLAEDSERNPDGTLKAWPTWLQEGKPSPTGRQTFTSWRLWKKDSPLQESGLLGPVVLQPVERIALESER